MEWHGHMVTFAADLIAYEFVGASLSDAKFMIVEYMNYLNESFKVIY